MPHATGFDRIELVLEQRARAIEERRRVGDAVAERLHQPRRAAERVAQRALHRPRGRASHPRVRADRRTAAAPRAAPSRSADPAARAWSRPPMPIASSVPPFSTNAFSFCPAGLTHAECPRPLGGIVALGVQPVDDPGLRGAGRQQDDVVLLVEVAGEVLRLDDLVVDAVLLEHPHQPAARHVAGALPQADARARLQAEAVHRRHPIDAAPPDRGWRGLLDDGLGRGVGRDHERAGRAWPSNAVAALKVGHLAFCSSATSLNTP